MSIAAALSASNLVAPYLRIRLRNGEDVIGTIHELHSDHIVVGTYNKDVDIPLNDIASISHESQCMCSECMARKYRQQQGNT
jgi:ribosome maturation factor RimP